MSVDVGLGNVLKMKSLRRISGKITWTNKLRSKTRTFENRHMKLASEFHSCSRFYRREQRRHFAGGDEAAKQYIDTLEDIQIQIESDYRNRISNVFSALSLREIVYGCTIWLSAALGSCIESANT